MNGLIKSFEERREGNRTKRIRFEKVRSVYKPFYGPKGYFIFWRNKL